MSLQPQAADAADKASDSANMPPPPPPSGPPMGAAAGASKNKKKKKKRKGAASVSSISLPPGSVPDQLESGASTPVTDLAFAPHPLSSADDVPAAEPMPGLPAHVPAQASALFADDAEEAAFLDNTRPDPAPVASEQPTRVQDTSQSEVTPEPRVAQLPAGVSTFLSGEANDIEGGAFESTSALDDAMEEAGREHAAAAALAASTKEEKATPADPASVLTPSHHVDVLASEPASSSASQALDAPPSATTTTTSTITRTVAESPSSHQPWMPSEDTEEVIPIATDDVESIAFDGPTTDDVLEGHIDTAEARADGVTFPQMPTELGSASALFADDNETDAFLPDGPPLQTFEPDFPPISPAKGDGANPPLQPEATSFSTMTHTAPELFAGETEATAYDIPTRNDIASQDVGGIEAKEGCDAPHAHKELGAASQFFADETETDAFLPEGDDLPTFEPDFPPVAPSFARSSDSATAPAKAVDTPASSAHTSGPPSVQQSDKEDTSKAAPPAVPSAQSLFAGEAESIAFDIPSTDDVLEGDVDVGAASREGVPTPQAPKELGAASALFADDNEFEAFLGTADDYPTFEPDFPPKPSAAAKDETKAETGAEMTPANTSSGAHALFAEDDDVSAFDIQQSHIDDHVPPSSAEPSKPKPSEANTSVAALFADDADSAFEIGLASPGAQDSVTASGTSRDPGHGATLDQNAGQPAESLAAGTQSIQSMFSPDDTHDWFVDTSLDNTLDLGRDEQGKEELMQYPADESEPAYDESQVPQGWYDDDGQFQWYTDEERADVRAAMIADGSLVASVMSVDASFEKPAPAPPSAPATSTSKAAPAANPYEPAPTTSYEPPRPYSVASPTGSYFRQQPTAPAPTSQFITPGISQASPYAPPAAGTSAYAPAASPYTPALPYGAADPSPYGPYAPGAGASQLHAAVPYGGVAKPPLQAAPPPPPEPIKRMKSTAYDPPLRQAKSFVGRPKSAAPPVHHAYVAPVVTPVVPETPPAPPPGPPKRSHTHGAAGVLSPPQPPIALSPPQASMPAFSRSYSAAAHPGAQETVSNPYDPAPAVSSYQPASYSGGDRSLSPPIQPPPRPATSGSTHPPKPTSFDPPLRPSLSRPQSRHATRPNFAQAPVTNPFPVSDATPPVPPIPAQFSAPPKTTGPPKASQGEQPPVVPPPRGPSRGATRSRASSPKYEKFEAAPPVPPIPAGLVSHPPRTASPLRAHTPPSAALGAPPRVTSPLKHEVRAEPSRKREAVSLHEEFDPEGGAGFWDEGESAFSQPPQAHSTPKWTSHDDTLASTGSPSTSYDAVPLAPEVDTYESGPAADDDPSKTPVARKVENPYASSGRPPLPPNAASHARLAAETSPMLTPRPPPVKRTPSNSYAAESQSPGDQSISLEDMYAPRRSVDQDAYAPSSRRTSQQHPPARRTSQQDASAPSMEQSTDYNPYSPPSPKKTMPSALKSPQQSSSPNVPSSPQRSPRAPMSPKKSTFGAVIARRTSSDYAGLPSQQARGHQQTHDGSDTYDASRTSHSRQSSVQDPYNPYAPSKPAQTHSRQASVQESYTPYVLPSQPAQSHSRQPSAQDMYNPYAPSSQPQSAKTDTYNPYAPSPTSPVVSKQDLYNSYSASSPQKSFSAYDQPAEFNPYAPRSATSPQQSLGGVLTSPSAHGGQLPNINRTNSYDPYAPVPMTQPNPDLYSPGMDANFGQRAVSPPQPNYFQSMGPMDPTYVPQQVLEQRPVSEDPLGRGAVAAHNIPLAVFGFGGVLITKFPGTADDTADAPSYGYASHRGLVTIQPVSEVAETSTLSTNSVPFPGPLVFDPATPKGAAGDKKRREAVLSYLSARSEEIERGLPYLKSNASAKRRDEEAKLVMMRVLTALVEGEGRVFGTSAAEEAIRAALQPPATVQPVPFTNGLGIKTATTAGATLAQLQQLSSMALSGDKKEAALFAANAGLWSHALVLASAVGPDLWRDIVARFSKAELSHDPKTAGLQSAYSVFGGITPETIDDLFSAANITDDPSADQWREVVAGVLFNGKPTDLVCLDDLGARFERAGLANAAQVCYLLSPNSPFSDMSPAANERAVKLVENARDEDGAIFAEIAEYARSLVPTPKGAEVPHASLPQLVPIKLSRAWRAAELGDTEQAKRYCEAIEASAKPTRNSRPHIARHVAASMEDLLERLTGEPSASPATGLGMRKSNKSLGSWIEGRLTKFIAGEDERPVAKPEPEPKATGGVPVGPFSHFSTISPGPSAGVSRAGSSVDIPVLNPYAPGPPSSSYDGGYQPWGDEDDKDTTPQGVPSVDISDESEFINPMAMANISLGGTPSQDDYKPAPKKPALEEDDDDDLGFGNSSLSRGRTPKAPEEDAPAKAEAPKAAAKEKDAPAGKDGKAGWFGGWFGGKKKEEGPRATRANLGEETSMIYDPDQKRWVVKGQKAAPSPTPTPPPPRAKTASPAGQKPTASGTHPPTSAPPSRLSMGSGALPNPPSSSQGGPPSRPPSGLPPSSSAPPVRAAPPAAAAAARALGAPPGASLDDLLSRPSSGRPGSAAAKKKGRAHGKYVDVFQG